ncbi:MAG: hypothetical protein ACREBU_12260 [Nitrososphaera sp.]
MKRQRLLITAFGVSAIILTFAVVGYLAGATSGGDATASEAKKFSNPGVFNGTSLQSYIAQKSADLEKLSAAEPQKEIIASVSFERPMTQVEIDEIVAAHRLKVDIFEFLATNNVKGVASVSVYPNLQKVQENVEDATVIGITYIVAFGEVAEFEKLNRNQDVILADIGSVKEIFEERAKGNIAWETPPPNLYGWYNKFK